MTSGSKYYIGWDVGGWNCDKNAASRDAIVIIDSTMAVTRERRLDLGATF